jgi:hypothetical protein
MLRLVMQQQQLTHLVHAIANIWCDMRLPIVKHGHHSRTLAATRKATGGRSHSLPLIRHNLEDQAIQTTLLRSSSRKHSSTPAIACFGGPELKPD